MIIVPIHLKNTVKVFGADRKWFFFFCWFCLSETLITLRRLLVFGGATVVNARCTRGRQQCVINDYACQIYVWCCSIQHCCSCLCCFECRAHCFDKLIFRWAFGIFAVCLRQRFWWKTASRTWYWMVNPPHNHLSLSLSLSLQMNRINFVKIEYTNFLCWCWQVPSTITHNS